MNLPIGPLLGSAVHIELRLFLSAPARIFAWVDFPDPSIPSITTKVPFLLIARSPEYTTLKH